MEEADEQFIEVRPENKDWVDMWESYKKYNLPPIRLFSSLDED
jgi:hypothetical protein